MYNVLYLFIKLCVIGMHQRRKKIFQISIKVCELKAIKKLKNYLFK